MAASEPGYRLKRNPPDETFRSKNLQCWRSLNAAVVYIDDPDELVQEDLTRSTLQASIRGQIISYQPASLLGLLVCARGTQTGPKVCERMGAPFSHTHFHLHKRVCGVRG